MKRRTFIKNSILAGVLTSAGFYPSCAAEGEKLKVLILGGTNFVGPAVVKAALDKKYDVTLFNRGITNPELFKKLRLIKGDRERGQEVYQALQQEDWDVVIDVWPQQSRLVDEAASALQDKTKHYIFISSIAVYNDFQEVGLHENSTVVRLNNDKSTWGYAEEKLQAENLIRERFPNRHTILRPAAIKGWRDPAHDLLYWCIKLKNEKAIIAPGSGLDPLQFIDVNDVGKFAVMAAENKLVGSYNVVGPKTEALRWKDFLTQAKTHLNSNTQLIWADEEFLKANEVYSFSDLPLWAPLSEDRGFMQISNQKLVDTGFPLTDLKTTLDDCLNWYEQLGSPELNFGSPETGMGLDRSRELALIEQLAKQVNQ